MWGVGGAVDMLAVLILLGIYLGAQDRAPLAKPAGKLPPAV